MGVDSLTTSMTIIHLSDLHITSTNQFETNNILRSLKSDIKRRIQEARLSDPVICITGDLTYSGKAEEFESVKVFCESLKNEIGASTILFSPGNHDLNWSDNLRDNQDLMEDLIDSAEKGMERVERRFERESDRKNLQIGMSNYYDFVKRMGQDYSQYLYSIKSLTKEKFKVNFISFNSAYLFSQKYSYYGYIGEKQINYATNEADSVGNLDPTFRVFNISMFHHPFEAIVPTAQQITENLIKGRSDMILTGHVHSLRAYIDITASLIGRHNTRSHPMICGARCVYDEVSNPHIVPGYSIITLSFDSDDIKAIGMYEISYDKNKMEWVRDPNNPTSPFMVTGEVSRVPELRIDGHDGIPKLQIGNIDDVISWGWNSVKLVDELEKIDYEVIEDLRPEDEGDTAPWARIRFNHPDTWRILFRSPGEIAGYWSFVPMFTENLEMLKSGRIIEGQISEDMIPAMELSGHFKIFFTMLALREGFRGTASIHLLYHSFLKVVEDLALQGIFFDEIATNAYTPSGEAVCKSFGMNYIINSPSKGKLYAMPFYPFPHTNVFAEHPRLLSLYKEEFDNKANPQKK